MDAFEIDPHLAIFSQAGGNADLATDMMSLVMTVILENTINAD